MHKLLFYLAYYYYLLIVWTVRVKLHGFENVRQTWNEGKNAVFCSPHNSILAVFVGVDKIQRPPVALIASLSKDGELIASLLLKRRFEMIRGSSSRGGKRALLEMQRAGQQGKSLGIAFDGPKGPPLVPKRGIVGCARAVNGPLFLVYAKPSHSKFFLKSIRVKSWDKMLLPVPFSKIDVYFENLPEKSSKQTDLEYEEQILNSVTNRSFEVFSGLYGQP